MKMAATRSIIIYIYGISKANSLSTLAQGLAADLERKSYLACFSEMRLLPVQNGSQHSAKGFIIAMC